MPGEFQAKVHYFDSVFWSEPTLHFDQNQIHGNAQ